jgi:uncharacterized protein
LKILIFGGTGFIGRHLIPLLISEGYEVLLFTRNPDSVANFLMDKINTIGWDTNSPENIVVHFRGEYAVINLAGESIGAKLWTKKQKNKILSSRLMITTAIAEAIHLSADKPVSVLQGSAIGFYGFQSDTKIDERSAKGKGFLADVVAAWELAMNPISNDGIRIINIRTGIVLGNDGGILPLILLPFKFFMGGHTGNGKQWISWIHISDVVQAMIFLLKNKTAAGVYNLTSPEPMMMKDFAKLAGKALRRPSWFHIPAFVLRLLPNEMADDLLLTSQRVIPERLMESGFEFKYKDAESALRNLVDKNKDHE